jgi:hypothetical protein
MCKAEEKFKPLGVKGYNNLAYMGRSVEKGGECEHDRIG